MKLNLGCGANKLDGFLNVDIVGEPDYKHDLEVTPWPFAENDSVDEITAQHVLEHLGRDTPTYFAIIKEFYRVCRDRAVIHIAFPHHRHDHAVADPAHVRQLTTYSFMLFDQNENRRTRAGHFANSTLGLDLGVDFYMTNTMLVLEEDISRKLAAGELAEKQIDEMARHQNNIIREVRFDWIVRKEAR